MPPASSNPSSPPWPCGRYFAVRSAATPVSRRPVWFARGWVETPVYARADLLQGHAVSGPALIEESASVTVLDPSKKMAVDRYGNLLISS